MRMRGLEPPRGSPHTALNRARLPIPPHPRELPILAGAGRTTLAKRWVVTPDANRSLQPCSVSFRGSPSGSSCFFCPCGPERRAAAAREEVVVQLAAAPIGAARGHAAGRPGPRPRRSRAPAGAAHLRARSRTPASPGRYRRVVVGLAGRRCRTTAVPRLARLQGWRPSTGASGYRASVCRRDRSRSGAPGALWGAGLSGEQRGARGSRFGIIGPGGVDPSNPYSRSVGLSRRRPGFPKGNRRFTTAKVIVARAFAPPSVHDRRARGCPSSTAQRPAHLVAGIAAGNCGCRGPPAGEGRPGVGVSVAPLA